MLRVNIHDAKTHLSRYAKRVKAGETVLLCDRNKPFAEIRPLAQPKKSRSAERRMGMDEGKISLPPDWDSPQTNAAIATLFGIPAEAAPR